MTWEFEDFEEVTDNKDGKTKDISHSECDKPCPPSGHEQMTEGERESFLHKFEERIPSIFASVELPPNNGEEHHTLPSQKDCTHIELERQADYLQEIRDRLNGIKSIKTLQQRLSTVYAFIGMSDDQLKQADLFFKALNEHFKGGMNEGLENIELRDYGVVQRRKRMRIPTIVRFASLVPQEMPPLGMKWLPLRAKNKRYPVAFISIPEQMETKADFLHVLDQLALTIGVADSSSLQEDFNRWCGPDFKIVSKLQALMKIIELGCIHASYQLGSITHFEEPTWVRMFKERLKLVKELIVTTMKQIDSIDALQQKLSMVYAFLDEDTGSRPSVKHWAEAVRFFKALEEYLKGSTELSVRQIAGRTTRPHLLKSGERLPYLIRYASIVPQTEPPVGMKWLPIRTRGIYPDFFLLLPERINSAEDITQVWAQLGVLVKRAKSTQEYSCLEKAFIDEYSNIEEIYKIKGLDIKSLSKEQVFMTILGLTLADSHFRSTSRYSDSLELRASSGYSWAKYLGDRYKVLLAQLGISCTYKLKKSPNKTSGENTPMHHWGSASSSLILWMKRSCFGLHSESIDSTSMENTEAVHRQTKTYMPVAADWILDLPHKQLVSFVQGLADGDGSVSIETSKCSIASVPNPEFIRRVLVKLNIESNVSGSDVVIRKNNAIIQAANLPLFIGAVGKFEKLNKLVKYIKGALRGPYTDLELDIIIEAHKQKKSIEWIIDTIFERSSEKYGTGWYRTPSAISKKIERMFKDAHYNLD
ncbi:MAG: hypothetical protein ACTSYL_05895 [Candidatus Thorarchaeota archaeon]